jgi:hypothetical protein
VFPIDKLVKYFKVEAVLEVVAVWECDQAGAFMVRFLFANAAVNREYKNESKIMICTYITNFILHLLLHLPRSFLR